MWRFSIYLILFLLMQGCIGTSKMRRIIDEKVIIQQKNLGVNTSNNQIKVGLSAIIRGNENKVHKEKFNFIPAILYWSWNSTHYCELNPIYAKDIVLQSIRKTADSLNLDKKLGNRRIEIEIESLPGQFLYENKASIIIFIVAYASNTFEGITPTETNLKISYKILDEKSKIIKSDKITLLNNEKPIQNVWKFSKKFVWSYVDEYEKNLRSLSKELVIKLNKNLPPQ